MIVTTDGGHPDLVPGTLFLALRHGEGATTISLSSPDGAYRMPAQYPADLFRFVRFQGEPDDRQP